MQNPDSFYIIKLPTSVHNPETLANYPYLADGTKLAATDNLGDGLVYLGSLVYRKLGHGLVLESAAFEGGRFIANGTTPQPNYFITDHLGSVRVVVNAEGAVLERNDYYPFGKRWDEGLISGYNRHRYNAKEEQGFLNLPYNDYGARMADPTIGGRWITPDPLMEKYYPIGQYVFCAGNPVKHIDPDGRGIKEAAYYLNRSISANLTIGVQGGISMKLNNHSIGIKANAASVDIVRVTKGEVVDSNTTQQVQKGVEIGVGLLSITTGTTVTQEQQPNSAKSEITRTTSTAVAVGIISAEQQTIETFETQNNKIVNNSKTTKSDVKTKEISIGASAFIGAEVSINLDDFIRGVTELFKKSE